MKRTKLAIGTLTACAAMMVAGPSVEAQQSSRQNRDANQTQNKSDQNRDRQKNSQRQRNADRNNANRNADSDQNRRGQSQQRSGVLSHFLAGYYAGYSDGWVDGADELLIGVVKQQRQGAQQRAERGQSPDKMQSGRKNARYEMRERMHADTSRGKSESQKRSSTVSLSGEVTAIKTVPVKNTDIEHRVVRLKTDSGSQRIVDLGPTQQTKKLQIQEGDDIEVRGLPVMSGDFRILAARQVTADNRSVNIQYKTLNLNDRESEVSTQTRSHHDKTDHAKKKSRSKAAHESRIQ